MDFQILHLLLRQGKEYGHERIRASGLTDTEHLLCSHLYRHAGCSQEDAVSALVLDKTTVAKALQSLEGKGLLVREPDEEDRRRKKLFLTEAGREKIAELISIHDEWLSKTLSVLTPEEQQQFEALCRRIAGNAR